MCTHTISYLRRSSQKITLSHDEIRELTGYVRPVFQMRILKDLGIPARRRPDNSVLVLRMHCWHPLAQPQKPNDAPKLKSSRK
jgi:hypothetical protein